MSSELVVDGGGVGVEDIVVVRWLPDRPTIDSRTAPAPPIPPPRRPANFLLRGDVKAADGCALVLADFSLAVFWQPGASPLTDRSGSAYFIAPEVRHFRDKLTCSIPPQMALSTSA